MNRSNAIVSQSGYSVTSYKQKVAYHEAGHAVAIHINNRLKNLPPVFFQIIFRDVGDQTGNCFLTDNIDQHRCISKVNGGLLVQSLLFSFDVLEHRAHAYADNSVSQYTDDYRLAFEADIVNLLIGPLAEAKYSAQIDNEPFNLDLVPTQALKYYGGEADLAVVNDYLESFSAHKHVQAESLSRLFIQAYDFISDQANWRAITRLAQYILASDTQIIGCDEVAMVLDSQ